MPMGSKHRLTGILRWDGDHGFTLAVDGGGWWELDFPCGLRDAADEALHDRITVEGVRSGFNILDVRVLRVTRPEGELELGMRPWWLRLLG